jgi:hypothetical protein
MPAAPEYYCYEATIWHLGRMVRARLHYLETCERSYRVARLISIEELAEVSAPPTTA